MIHEIFQSKCPTWNNDCTVVCQLTLDVFLANLPMTGVQQTLDEICKDNLHQFIHDVNLIINAGQVLKQGVLKQGVLKQGVLKQGVISHRLYNFHIHTL